MNRWQTVQAVHVLCDCDLNMELVTWRIMEVSVAVSSDVHTYVHMYVCSCVVAD